MVAYDGVERPVGRAIGPSENMAAKRGTIMWFNLRSLGRAATLAATVGLASALIPAAANAATISFTDSVPVTNTNWTESITLNKFDSSLGTLTGVTFELIGEVSGQASYESLDSAPAVISLNLQATIELDGSGLGLGTIVQVLPVANVTDNASDFDGTIDFGGTSGGTFTGLNQADSDVGGIAPANFALFIGGPGDTFSLDVEANGSSIGSGAGNLITQFSTNASAEVTVTYTYTSNEIPEPATLALIGAGLAGIGVARSRRKRN